MSNRILIAALLITCFGTMCCSTQVAAQSSSRDYSSFAGMQQQSTGDFNGGFNADYGGGYNSFEQGSAYQGGGHYQDQYPQYQNTQYSNGGYADSYGADCGSGDCFDDGRGRYFDGRVSARVSDRFANISGRRQNRSRRNFAGTYFEECGDYDPSCYDTGECCQRGPFYISGFGGWSSIDNFLRRTDIEDGDTTLQTVGRIGAEVVDGGGVGLAVGRYIHPRGRAEFEITYRDNGVEEVFTNQTELQFDAMGNSFGDPIETMRTEQDASGNLNVLTGMYNVLFDFKRRQVGCAHLYAGGGVGAIYVDGDFSTTGATPTDFEVDSSGFAYQGIVGVAYPARSGLDFFTEYRYTGSQNISVEDTTAGQSLGAFRLDSHNLFLGVRVYR